MPSKIASPLLSSIRRLGGYINPLPHFRNARNAWIDPRFVAQRGRVKVLRSKGIRPGAVEKIRTSMRPKYDEVLGNISRGTLRAGGLLAGAGIAGRALSPSRRTLPSDTTPTTKESAVSSSLFDVFRRVHPAGAFDKAASAAGLRSLLGRVGSALNPVPHFRDARLARRLGSGGIFTVDEAARLQSQSRKALLRGLKATGLATGAAAVPIGGAVAGARALTAPTDKNANEKTAFYACIGDRYIITKGEKRGKIGKCVSNTRNERCEEYVDDDGTKVTKRREDCTLKIELPDGSTYETSSPDAEVRSYYGEKSESDVESLGPQLEGRVSETEEGKIAAAMDPENTTGRDKIAAMLRRVINGDEGLDQIINHLKAAKAKKALAG